MASFLRRLPGLTTITLLFAGAAFAQTSQIEGVVKGEDGQPLKDALIKIERKDIKGNYKVRPRRRAITFTPVFRSEPIRSSWKWTARTSIASITSSQSSATRWSSTSTCSR